MNDRIGAIRLKARVPMLRIQRLLGTRINLVRVEFMGDDVRGLARLGALLMYGPFVVIGYLFLVAGLARLIALRVGWGWSFFMLGGAHVLIGLYGLATGQQPDAEAAYPVLEPDIDGSDDDAADRLDTLVTGQSTPPAFPPRTGSSF